uniref:Uncharacterized protein n=1 Tax=Syphacia muris TaxID=451379 RepID=A0A0N5B0Q8_9BILA
MLTVFLSTADSANSKSLLSLDAILAELDDTSKCNRSLIYSNIHRLIDGTLRSRHEWPNFLEIAKLLSEQTDPNVTLRKISNWRDKAKLLYRPIYLTNLSQPIFFLQLYCTANKTIWTPILAFPTKIPELYLILKPVVKALDICQYSQCKTSKVGLKILLFLLIL